MHSYDEDNVLQCSHSQFPDLSITRAKVCRTLLLSVVQGMLLSLALKSFHAGLSIRYQQ